MNLILLFVNKELHNEAGVTNSLLNVAFCFLGMIFNYMRLKKPKA